MLCVWAVCVHGHMKGARLCQGTEGSCRWAHVTVSLAILSVKEWGGDTVALTELLQKARRCLLPFLRVALLGAP